METKMKAAVMQKIRKMELVERPIPDIKEDEVLVKVEYVGICGSDLHYYEQGFIGDYVVKPPFVLGHECGGTVVKIGNEVKNIKLGDKVALEPGKTCGKCEFCKKGQYNLCSEVQFFATPPVNGVFQEYVAHAADLCFKIPDSMDTLEAALIEPMAVGFHAANQGEVHLGQTVAVFGAGCIGLASMQACIAMGASRVIVVDVVDKRLEKAKELGAWGVINGNKEQVIKEIMKLTENKGVDVAVETAGTEITTNQSIHAVKKGANIVLVGYGKTGKMNLEMSRALDKEITFKTVFRYRNIYPMAIDAAASGKVNLKGMVTNIFTLDEIQKAMDMSIEQKEDIVKSVIKM